MTEAENNVDLKKEFLRLKEIWQKDTAFSSKVETSHPAYQQIIAFGKPIVPIILKDLEKEPNWWFTALSAITGKDPVRQKQWGNLEQMTNTWLEWGRKMGLLVES